MSLISSTLPQPAKLFCFAVSAAAGYAATSNLIEKYAPTFQHKTACCGLLACAVSIPISQSKLLTGCFTALCVAYVMFYNHAQKQPSEVVQPKTIIAADGVNQYNAGGPSACTPLACRFIASQDPASPEMLKKLIEANTYRRDEHLETEQCIRDTGLIRAENPWAWMAEESMQATVKKEPMQVTFKRNGVTDLTEAVKTLLGSNEIHGAIIIANAITIGMRKCGDAVEFFDSHGDASRNHNNTAYVIQFENNQMDQMADFLAKMFPKLIKNSQIEIWPIQPKEMASKADSLLKEKDTDDGLEKKSIRSLADESKTAGEDVIHDLNADGPHEFEQQLPNLLTFSDAQPYPATATRETITNSNLAPIASQQPLVVRTSNPKISCTFISDSEKLCPELTNILYFDAPTVVHNDSTIGCLLSTGCLLRLKIQDVKELMPFLSKNLLTRIPQDYKLSASILVVKQVDNQNWHELCFQGPLARYEKDGQLQNYPRLWDQTLNYSWTANVGMFGRFGHADKDIQKSSTEHVLFNIHRNPRGLKPLFMPFEKLEPSEQQLIDDELPLVTNGTSVYVSGEQPIEGGFALCCNNGQAHISLVMVCNTQTGKEIEGMVSNDRIKALRAKLRDIKGAESAYAVLDNIKL